MTSQQMIEYLGRQCQSAGQELERTVRQGNPDAIAAKHLETKFHMEFLKGYATAMEHAGLMEKAQADEFFAAVGQIGAR